MSEKIKVIIKRPDEKIGHMTNISNSLENLQRTVEGNIEVVHIGKGLLLICNEEGKLLGLPPNFRIVDQFAADVIQGTAIICGEDDCNFSDIPISIGAWRLMLSDWGNRGG